MAFITVYSNFPQGETVRFQVWDQSECRLFQATEERFTFSANTTLGNPLEPQLLRATELGAANVLSVPLGRGWTWFSTNIRLTDPSVTNMLATLQPAAGDLVKSQSAFSQFAATTGWVGPLAELENTASYQIRLAEPADLIFDGTALDPAEAPIPLSQGWNWIGYIPEDVLPLNQALTDLVAQPDDQIKSQDGFAQFVEISPGNSAWIGNLQLLTPGQGYRLWLQNPLQDTFTYPAMPLVAAKTMATGQTCGCSTKTLAAKPEWSVDPRAYEYSMTLTAALENDGVQAIGPQDLVAAFVGDQVRGVAQPLYVEALDQPLVFLMVHSTQAAGEDIHFKVFHQAQDTVLVLPHQLSFAADAALGTPLEPLALNTADAVAPTRGSLPLVFALSQNFPNPFNPSTEIQYQIPTSGHVRLSIYNLLGQPIRQLVNGPLQAGRYSTTWDGTDNSGKAVSNGVYFYRLDSGVNQQTKRMLLLK